MTQLDSDKTDAGLSAELEEARAQLAELKRQVERGEQYRATLDAVPDPIFSLTPDGRYAYANQALADVHQTSVEELVGKGMWDFLTKDEADRRFALLSQVFRTGEAVLDEGRVSRAGGDL